MEWMNALAGKLRMTKAGVTSGAAIRLFGG